MSNIKLAESRTYALSRLALSCMLMLTATNSLATASDLAQPKPPVMVAEPLRIDACDEAENRIFSAQAGQIVTIFGECEFTIKIDDGEVQVNHDREIAFPVSAGTHVIKIVIHSHYEGIGPSNHEVAVNAT